MPAGPKRAISMLATVAVAAASVAVVIFGATSRSAAGTPPRLMVVGDSISQGSAGDFTWRYRLYEHLVQSGTPVDMVGPRTTLYDNVAERQGDEHYADPNFDADHDSLWGRAAWQEADTIAGEVAAASPDYLLVLLGINDLGWASESAGVVEASLRLVVSNARTTGPDVKVLIGKVLPTARAQTDTEFAGRVAALNARVSTIASSMSTADSPVVAVDTGNGFVAADDTWDGNHPNANGELKIAAAFQDALAGSFGLGTAFVRPLPVLPTGPRTAPQLTAVAGHGQATLSWTPSPGATGYWVWSRDVTTDSRWAKAAEPLTAPSSPWTAGPLVDGDTYAYELQPAKGMDAGVFSNVVTVTPTPAIRDGTTLTASASTTIRYGSATTIRTTLDDTRTHQPIRGAGIELQRRTATAWVLAATRTTASTGQASAVVAPHGRTTYRWWYAGDVLRTPATSRSQTVSVAEVVSARSTAARVRHGTAVTIYGVVKPASLGQTVSLQRLVGTTWKTIATITIKRQRLPNGVTTTGYAVRTTPTTRATARYRTYKRGTATLTGAHSGTVTIAVT